MLKAQLHSNKISRLEADWEDIEDILTGDFFGVLDYLPRRIYLKDFIAYIVSLNPDIQLTFDDDVDWENAKVLFWPRTYTDKENAEPDVVIISNCWVIVIEVKLLSGLGDSQPWREYCIGRRIAEDYAVPQDSVFYLVVARGRLDISQQFKSKQGAHYKELAEKTLYLKWYQAVNLISSWLNTIAAEQTDSLGYYRMLSDLYQAMRRRRILVFSAFSFTNASLTNLIKGRIFCPSRFLGFVRRSLVVSVPSENVFLRQKSIAFGAGIVKVQSTGPFVFLKRAFNGFLSSAPTVQTDNHLSFWSFRFSGFAQSCLSVLLPAGRHPVFLASFFSGFAKASPQCNRSEYIFFKE